VQDGPPEFRGGIGDVECLMSSLGLMQWNSVGRAHRGDGTRSTTRYSFFLAGNKVLRLLRSKMIASDGEEYHGLRGSHM